MQLLYMLCAAVINTWHKLETRLGIQYGHLYGRN